VAFSTNYINNEQKRKNKKKGAINFNFRGFVIAYVDGLKTSKQTIKKSKITKLK
jgi:hypothetical protein